jgi:UDP-N-acetyl-D-glucosamine dehydrogenase
MDAEVSAADPHVVEVVPEIAGIRLVEATAEEVAAADAVILLADHDEFDLEMVRANAKYVLDTRHRITGANVEVI